MSVGKSLRDTFSFFQLLCDCLSFGEFLNSVFLNSSTSLLYRKSSLISDLHFFRMRHSIRKYSTNVAIVFFFNFLEEQNTNESPCQMYIKMKYRPPSAWKTCPFFPRQTPQICRFPLPNFNFLFFVHFQRKLPMFIANHLIAILCPAC